MLTATRFLLGLLVLSAFSSLVQGRLLQTSELSSLSNKEVGYTNDVATKQPPIVPIGDEYQNSLPLLNNRFRVDDEVDTVTMVFFRSLGAEPIVLVKPDGTKVFYSMSLSDSNIDWYETDTYDMIKMKSPMPGPWQALGQILPNSKVMILSDIELAPTPIPNIVFSGEILKQSATLMNEGKPVDYTEFRDVVTLDIEFVSTNKPDHDNFASGSKTIARFEDNGMGLDESAADGVFTGQFKLNIPAGEWQPIFKIATPLQLREQLNEVILLRKNPMIAHATIDETKEGYHLFTLDADEAWIKRDSILVDGRVSFPNGEMETFSITAFSSDIKSKKIVNVGFGVYKIKVTAFAQTNDGREVVIDVPEYSFVTQAPEVIVDEQPSATNVDQKVALTPSQQSSDGIEELSSAMIMAIIIMNIFIVILGGLFLFLVINKRNNPNNHYLGKWSSMIKMLFSRKKMPVDDSTSLKTD